MGRMQTLAAQIADLYHDRPRPYASELDRFLWLCRKAVLLEEVADNDPTCRRPARQVADATREQARDLLGELLATELTDRKVA